MVNFDNKYFLKDFKTFILYFYNNVCPTSLVCCWHLYSFGDLLYLPVSKISECTFSGFQGQTIGCLSFCMYRVGYCIEQ
jgi:hypothetical protein